MDQYAKSVMYVCLLTTALLLGGFGWFDVGLAGAAQNTSSSDMGIAAIVGESLKSNSPEELVQLRKRIRDGDRAQYTLLRAAWIATYYGRRDEATGYLKMLDQVYRTDRSILGNLLVLWRAVKNNERAEYYKREIPSYVDSMKGLDDAGRRRVRDILEYMANAPVETFGLPPQ